MIHHYRIEIPQTSYPYIENLREHRARLEELSDNLQIVGNGDHKIDILEGDTNDEGIKIVGNIIAVINEFNTFLANKRGEVRSD